MSDRESRLEGMTDQELSREWVRAMTVHIDPEDRTAQLAAIDTVVAEINARAERHETTKLVITPDDALTVSEFLKSTVVKGGSGWYNESEDRS